MVVVAPICTFYVASKESNEYSALFLEEATTTEFIIKLAQSIGIPASVFRNLYIVGPHGILIKVTDSVVHFTKPESVFQYTLRSSQHHTSLPISSELQNGSEQITHCDVILENATPSHGVTNEVMSTTANHTSHHSNHGQMQVSQSGMNGEHNRLETIARVNRNISPYPRGGGSTTTESNSTDNRENSNVNHSSVTASIL